MGFIDFFSQATRDISDMTGFTNYAKEERDEAQAREDVEYQREQSARAENFQLEQYDKWQSIYGSLQEDLGTYYKNLTGATLAAPKLQAIQEEAQKAQKQTDIALAQRGLTGGGLEAQALMQNQFGTAMQKANVRATADQAAAEQKLGFLGVGLGQGAQMLGNLANVGNTNSGIAGNIATTSLNNAGAFARQNLSGQQQGALAMQENMYDSMSTFGGMMMGGA